MKQENKDIFHFDMLENRKNIKSSSAIEIPEVQELQDFLKGKMGIMVLLNTKLASVQNFPLSARPLLIMYSDDALNFFGINPIITHYYCFFIFKYQNQVLPICFLVLQIEKDGVSTYHEIMFNLLNQMFFTDLLEYINSNIHITILASETNAVIIENINIGNEKSALLTKMIHQIIQYYYESVDYVLNSNLYSRAEQILYSFGEAYDIVQLYNKLVEDNVGNIPIIDIEDFIQ